MTPQQTDFSNYLDTYSAYLNNNEVLQLKFTLFSLALQMKPALRNLSFTQNSWNSEKIEQDLQNIFNKNENKSIAEALCALCGTWLCSFDIFSGTQCHSHFDSTNELLKILYHNINTLESTLPSTIINDDVKTKLNVISKLDGCTLLFVSYFVPAILSYYIASIDTAIGTFFGNLAYNETNSIITYNNRVEYFLANRNINEAQRDIKHLLSIARFSYHRINSLSTLDLPKDSVKMPPPKQKIKNLIVFILNNTDPKNYQAIPWAHTFMESVLQEN